MSPVDPQTLFLIVSGIAVGVFGGRRTASSTWRDLFDAERVRSTELSEKVAEQAKLTAELTADLASLRARPDMTMLAAAIQKGVAQMQSEHQAIIASVQDLAQTIRSLRDDTPGPGLR